MSLKYSHDQRTLQQLAQEVLDVQDACNLSGVVHGFSQAISRLRELNPNEGTDFFNHHPICVLYANIIDHLTEINLRSSAYDRAYRVCEHLSGRVPNVDAR